MVEGGRVRLSELFRVFKGQNNFKLKYFGLEYFGISQSKPYRAKESVRVLLSVGKLLPVTQSTRYSIDTWLYSRYASSIAPCWSAIRMDAARPGVRITHQNHAASGFIIVSFTSALKSTLANGD
jgi:hypothetical protein